MQDTRMTVASTRRWHWLFGAVALASCGVPAHAPQDASGLQPEVLRSEPPSGPQASPRAAWLTLRGFEQDADGGWERRSDREALAQGLVQVDEVFMDPAARGAAGEGQFPCGDAWLAIDDANDYHSVTGHEWRIADQGFIAYSTCSRATTLIALEWMNYVRPELMRLFGHEPKTPATVILLRNQEQYNGFAVTQAEIGELPSDSMGWAAFHYAFPCDRWLDRAHGLEPVGAACAYWDDRTVAGNAWGPYAVRHAAAQAFVEALDPSPKAMEFFLRDIEAPFPSQEFWSEKRVPLWLRYGAAMHCERFALQPGDDPPGIRRWSLAELEASGGPVPLEELFRFPLDPTDPEASIRLLLSSGALVAFLLDGSDGAVADPLRRFQTALGDDAASEEAQSTTGSGPLPAARVLEGALLTQRDRFQSFIAGYLVEAR